MLMKFRTKENGQKYTSSLCTHTHTHTVKMLRMKSLTADTNWIFIMKTNLWIKWGTRIYRYKKFYVWKMNFSAITKTLNKVFCVEYSSNQVCIEWLSSSLQIQDAVCVCVCVFAFETLTSNIAQICGSPQAFHMAYGDGKCKEIQ